MDPHAPLAAIGIASAVDYRTRRDALRDTWFHYPECVSGEVLVRFVVARPADDVLAGSDETSAIDAEAARTDDVVLLQTGVTGRMWSPLHTTFRWLQHAVTTAPFQKAQYIGKMDDDAYLNVPEMARHLRHMRVTPTTAPEDNVYYGLFYWTSYRPGSYTHFGSSYDMLSAQRAFNSCILSGECEREPVVGSFPFTTGSMQLLSRSLAHTLASSSEAAEHIDRSKVLLQLKREAPAFEDVWMGYAIHALLPSVRNVTMVGLERYAYYSEALARPAMKNTTILVHLAGRKDASRMHAAHAFSQRQHCASSGQLLCRAFRTPRCPKRNLTAYEFCMQRTQSYLRKYASRCSLQPDVRCPKGPAFEILPPKPASAAERKGVVPGERRRAW
jgi:hypothetical protein